MVLCHVYGMFCAVFMACFVPCLWHVLCCVCGMFGGLNWVGIEACEKGLFLGRFRVKIWCTREATCSLAGYCA